MYDARMLVVLVLGAVATLISWAMIIPPSRELVIKLGTLIDMAERGNGELFREQLAPISPVVSGRFVHRNVTRVLKVDFTRYGEVCQRLHREASKLDRRAHIGMLPFGVYLLGAALWWVLR